MPGGNARNITGAEHARWIAGYLAGFLIGRSVMPSRAPRNFRPGRVEGFTKKVREKIYEFSSCKEPVAWRRNCQLLAFQQARLV